MRTSRRRLKRLLQATACLGLVTSATAADTPTIRFLDQGPNWNADLRKAYYSEDQGSQMIPLAWLRALHQADGRPFLDGALARYGYLPPDGPPTSKALPIGFTTAASAQGPVVGMTCAACHVREITYDRKTYRIDGAPAFADFGAMVTDLDAAVRRVLDDKPTFAAFSTATLGAEAKDAGASAKLRTDVELWWVRFHTWVGLSLPKDRRWGPTRLDAMGMIFNRIAGLDVGAAPTYLIPENISRADAPVRYPFLWNSPRQDFTQWAGFDPNGNDFLALIRNLGQVYGVFADFHPQPVTAAFSPLDRNYLADNSANFRGLGANENMLKRIGPPVWPWPVDRALAKRGEAIFQRPAAAGGCAECHGIEDGLERPDVKQTWKTRIKNVGTDTRQWQVLMRAVTTGSMEGASLPGGPPLGPRAGSLDVLKVAVIGTIINVQAVEQAKKQQAGGHPAPAPSPKPDPHAAGAMKVGGKATDPSKPAINVYEAKVLQGVWAAAPYLHNGSVPTLADLLEPPARRPRIFQVGPAYDPRAVGLSREQTAGAFVLKTTGCDDRASGDSNCGHAYGTALAADEKKALLEYLKTL